MFTHQGLGASLQEAHVRFFARVTGLQEWSFESFTLYVGISPHCDHFLLAPVTKVGEETG